MVGAFPLPCRDSVGSFPVKAELPMGRVSSSAHDLPWNKISHLKISMPNLGVAVLGHAVLVSCESLFGCRPNLVN